MDAADTVELHTPPMNKIGLPDGYIQHRIRDDFDDLCRVYGREHAEKIWNDVPKEMSE